MSDYRFEYLDLPEGEPEKPKKKRTAGRFIWRSFTLLLQLGLIAILVVLISGAGGYLYLSNELEGHINKVVAYQGQGPGGTPRFYDRNGNLLFEVTTVEKRKWLLFSEIPDFVKDATVAVEDDTFWTNLGFDPAAIGAAVLSNYRNDGGRPVGASTITQQLVRSIAFTYEERVTASYERKLREIFLAGILTQKRSKASILTMYLNEIYYGNLAYGIEAAAQTYFGKPAADLTLAEAALLVGLPQSPIELDPYTNFAAAKARQELVLDLLAEDGKYGAAEIAAAKAESITLAPLINPNVEAEDSVLEAPHFVVYVQQELERRYGPDAIARGGWQITTSLDLDMHNMAQTAAREWIAGWAPAHDVDNASIVILKPGTGEILTMVGSLDYFDSANDGQVNVALQPRQPGSSIKPVTYAAALEVGWTTGDVLWDVPIKLDLGNGELMQPVNYDNRYHGPVLFRDALANSYNIPPIQLIRDIGISTMIGTGRRMGINSLQEQPGFYGLSLTLGGGDVTLLEMTHAYATLANTGRRPQLTSILRIVDSRGRVVFDAQNNRIPAVNAIKPQVAHIITDILDDDQARIPAMGLNNALNLPFPAAAKTGTTNDFRDNWTLGYTPGVVVGVWIGNTDGHPMIDSSGLRGAAPLWQRVMTTIHDTPLLFETLYVNGAPPPTEFPPVPNIEEREVCLPRGSGGGTCTASRTDLFIVGGPITGFGRLGYTPDKTSVPGTWKLNVLFVPGDVGATINQAQLLDGTRPPTPTICTVNSGSNVEGVQTRLFLPVPSHYPDEVRARIWASQYGYSMAPAISCPLAVVRGAAPAASTSGSGSGVVGSTGNTVGSSGGSSGSGASGSYVISSPRPGATVSGVVAITGSANFDIAQAQYYKLEIGSGTNPTEWTTFGTTHSTPVVSGQLETLNAAGLPPGNYVIRLVVVQNDGNFPTPYRVPIVVTN